MKRLFIVLLSVLFVGAFCTACGENTETGGDAHEHTYGEWTDGSDATCETAGTLGHYTCDVCGKHFDANYNEIEDINVAAKGHEYGDMYYALPATFFHDGNVAYYECSVCGKKFDENKSEIGNEKTERLSTEISLVLGSEEKAFTVVSSDENHIEWAIENVSLEEGQTVALAKTGNTDVVYDYFEAGNSNITDDGKIYNTAIADVFLSATPNGLMLFIGGYKYKGIVVETTSAEGYVNQYPMANVNYRDSEEKTYIYGYHYFSDGDKFTVKDNVNDLVYDYDDLADSEAWKTYDLARADGGEIIVKRGGRFGIEFDKNGNKKITADKIFGPVEGNSFFVEAKGEEERARMSEKEYEKGGEAYEDLLWYIEHEKTKNVEDILNYIEVRGLYIYSFTSEFPAGAEIRIYNATSATYSGGEKLVDIIGSENPAGVAEVNGEYIKILTGGNYVVTYMPAFDSVALTAAQTSAADVNMYLDGGFIPLTKGADGKVSYGNLAATTSTNVAFLDDKYNFLPVVLSTETDATVASVSSNTVFFRKAGTFNLVYDTEKGELSIEIVSIVETPKTYNYKFNNETSMTVNPENADEYAAENQNLTVSSPNYVYMFATDYSEYKFIGALDEASSSLGTTVSQDDSAYFTVKKDGTYNVYFNIKTLEIRLVLVTGAPDAPSYSVSYYFDGSYALLGNFAVDENDESKLVLETEYAVYAGDEFFVKDGGGNTYTDLADETDSQYVKLNAKSRLEFIKGGLYKYIFDTETKKIDFVFVRELNDDEILIPAKLYIKASNIKTLTENSENTDEVCYLGLDAGSLLYVEIKVRTSDKTYIHDLTLSGDTDTTKVVTNGSAISFTAGGTVNIYIDKKTHVVRAVFAE